MTLLREAHIWDRVTLGGQVGGSDGGDGEGEGVVDTEGEGDGEGEGEDEGEREGGGEGDGDGRAVEVGKVGLEDGQVGRRPAQCM